MLRPGACVDPRRGGPRDADWAPCDEAVTRALVAQLSRDMGDGSHPEEVVVAGAADEATNPSPSFTQHGLSNALLYVYYSPLATFLLQHTTYHSPLTSYQLPLTTYQLTTYYRRSTASTC